MVNSRRCSEPGGEWRGEASGGGAAICINWMYYSLDVEISQFLFDWDSRVSFVFVIYIETQKTTKYRTIINKET